MDWLYKNTPITDISQFPESTHGFVYNIKHIPTGKIYVGKKILNYTRKIKLTKKELKEYEGNVGRKPKHKYISKESDWKTYWGSNKYLKEFYKVEPKENFERHILILAPTKKLLTYYETKYQMIYEVLEKSDMFWNDNILGKFFTKDFESQN